jgi:hypothetical protein
MPMTKTHILPIPGLRLPFYPQSAPHKPISAPGDEGEAAPEGVKWDAMTPAQRLAEARRVLASTKYADISAKITVLGRLLNKETGMLSAETVGIAVAALGDAEPMIREDAAMRLKGLLDAPLRDIVAGLITTGKSPLQRAAAAWSVGMMKGAEYLGALAAALKDRDPLVQQAAAEAIRNIGTTQAEVPALTALLVGKNSPVRIAAVRALGVAGLDTVATLKGLLRDNDPIVRAEAIRGIATIAPEVFLKDVLTDEWETSTPGRIAKLHRLAEIVAANPADAAAQAALLKLAVKYLADPAWQVRVRAIQTLNDIGTAEVVDPLIGQLATETAKGGGRLLGDTLATLQSLTGQGIGPNVAQWREWWKINRDSFVPGAKTVEPTGEGGNTMAVPDLLGVRIISKRVVFVIAASKGSIEINPERIAAAIEALKKALSQMGPDTKAAVIMVNNQLVGTTDRSSGANLIPMNAAGKQKLLNYVGVMVARLQGLTRGRGDVYDAMLEAFKIPETDTVILLSGTKPAYGKFVYPGNIVDNVGIINEPLSIAIHTIRVGPAGDNKILMDGLANQNAGKHVDMDKKK